MIAWFGAGLLGSGFVRALRRRGEDVHVWNRTADKARLLEADGAKAFDDPAAAAAGAARVHLSLSDDASVDAVLDRAAPAFGPRTLIVDHTTNKASETAARSAQWSARGHVYVHAPVFMGPQNALESTGLMLVSGERDRVRLVEPFLAPMTGKVIDLGERPDAAAAFKLLGNLFLIFFNSGLAEMFTLARAMSIEPKAAATLFEHFNPGRTIEARAERMMSSDWSKASWTLAMARKDAGLMIDEAAHGQCPLAMLPALAARMDALIAEGHGPHDWTVLAKDAFSDSVRFH